VFCSAPVSLAAGVSAGGAVHSVPVIIALHWIIPVVEQFDELRLILARSESHGVRPELGLRVKLAAGQLSGAEAGAVLNGVNVAAIGSGDDGDWEVMQFAGATLVDDRLWEIGLRLRGQQGTDGVMPEIWPEGSLFVLLDGAPGQVDLPASARGLARHYRAGPARRGVVGSSYVARILAFEGVGLRPYAPAHLRARAVGGSLDLSWIRRTRIDGDSWAGLDVPLGEEGERYVVRVLDGAGAVLRTAEVTLPGWTYTAAARAADGAAGRAVEVAQLSAQFGAGSTGRIEIDG